MDIEEISRGVKGVQEYRTFFQEHWKNELTKSIQQDRFSIFYYRIYHAGEALHILRRQRFKRLFYHHYLFFKT